MSKVFCALSGACVPDCALLQKRRGCFCYEIFASVFELNLKGVLFTKWKLTSCFTFYNPNINIFSFSNRIYKFWHWKIIFCFQTKNVISIMLIRNKRNVKFIFFVLCLVVNYAWRPTAAIWSNTSFLSSIFFMTTFTSFSI